MSEDLPDKKPELELGRHQYSWRDRRSGKMVRDFSPRFCRNMMIGALLVLGYIFWHRTEITIESLFAGTAFMAFVAGGFFANWTKDHY